MAGSVNKVILIGNLGNDPEIRTMQQSGDKIANLSVATSESWTDKGTGEKKQNTQWHKVVVFSNQLADICEKYLKKGSKIYVEGQLETRKWQDQQGQDRYSTEVVIRQFRGGITMLDSAGGAGAGSYGGGASNFGSSPDMSSLTSGGGNAGGYGASQNNNMPFQKPQSNFSGSGQGPASIAFDDEVPF